MWRHAGSLTIRLSVDGGLAPEPNAFKKATIKANFPRAGRDYARRGLHRLQASVKTTNRANSGTNHRSTEGGREGKCEIDKTKPPGPALAVWRPAPGFAESERDKSGGEGHVDLAGFSGLRLKWGTCPVDDRLWITSFHRPGACLCGWAGWIDRLRAAPIRHGCWTAESGRRPAREGKGILGLMRKGRREVLFLWFMFLLGAIAQAAPSRAGDPAREPTIGSA